MQLNKNQLIELNLIGEKGKINIYQVAEYITIINDIIYLPREENFYIYSNKNNYWKLIDKSGLNVLIRNTIGNYSSRYVFNETIELLKADSKVNKGLEFKMNYYADKLPLNNTVINMNDFSIEEFKKELHNTYKIKINYNEKTTAKLFEEKLNQIIPDFSIQNILQEFFGLCLTTKVLTKALFLIGDGANGKSLIIKILSEMVGDNNISSLSLRQLNNPVEVVAIENKLLNICSELNPKDTKETDTFKKIVAGDTLQCNPKFKSGYQLKPFSKFIFAINEIPTTDDKTYAFIRRIISIPFNSKFVDSPEYANEYKKDIELFDKLKKEMSGILNWAIAGLKRLQDNNYKFTQSNIIENLKMKICSFNNPILKFLSDNFSERMFFFVFKYEIYEAYNNYLKKNKIKIITEKEFEEGFNTRIFKKVFPGVEKTRKNDKSGERKIGYLNIEFRKKK